MGLFQIKPWLSEIAQRYPLVNWLLEMVGEISEEDTPVTYSLIGIITGIFIIEIGMTRLYGLPQIQIFSTGLFGLYPKVAWIAAPLLHSGLLHWLASVVGLVFLGTAVERHWPQWRYLGFLIIAGYGATAAGALVMGAFTDSQLAFYGTSGIVFALAGFALVHPPWSHLRVRRIEWFAAFIGVIALLQILIDPLTGPYFDPYWINGGHTAGFVIGGVAAWYDMNNCDLKY